MIYMAAPLRMQALLAPVPAINICVMLHHNPSYDCLSGRPVFGALLSRALDALLLMQQADAALLLHRDGSLHLFEADCLTRHYLSNDVNLAALAAYHVALRERIGDALDGLDIQRIREMLWEKAMPHA